MRNFLKIKKSKIGIYLFLIFNQLIFSANALNLGKIDLINPKRNTNQKNNNNEFYLLSDNKMNNLEKDFVEEAKVLEKFVEETFGPDDFENFVDQSIARHFLMLF